MPVIPRAFNLQSDQVTVLARAWNGMVKPPQLRIQKEYSLDTQVYGRMPMLRMRLVLFNPWEDQVGVLPPARLEWHT
jgi:hypothetical protein